MEAWCCGARSRQPSGNASTALRDRGPAWHWNWAGIRGASVSDSHRAASRVDWWRGCAWARGCLLVHPVAHAVGAGRARRVEVPRAATPKRAPWRDAVCSMQTMQSSAHLLRSTHPTVVQTIVTYCLLDTIAVSASAQDWTHRERIDRNGLTARASIPCPCTRRGEVWECLSASESLFLQPWPRGLVVIAGWLPYSTVANHASAFIRRSDFTAELPNTIQLSLHLEQVYYRQSSLSSG
jgi:hypothetical protein